MDDEYISINKIAELKGLKSTRSIRLAIDQGKYIAREIEVRGGKSYEILYSSLEPEFLVMMFEYQIVHKLIPPVLFQIIKLFTRINAWCDYKSGKWLGWMLQTGKLFRLIFNVKKLYLYYKLQAIFWIRSF